jgi:Uncharacterized conserved protein
MQNAIQHTWFFPHPAETVWLYLTTPELIAEWLMANDFEAVPGRKFMFKSGPYPKIGFDGNIFCEVLEVIPHKKLSYSWKFGPAPGNITYDTIVSWTLIAKDGGTELKLEQTGFQGEENIPGYRAMHEGWDVNIKKILTKLNTTLKS